MDAQALKDQYNYFCQQTVTVRRSTGLGSSRTGTDYETRGNARLYSATELVGSVTQGDMRVIVLAEQLEEQGFEFPLKTSDAIVVNDIERAIKAFGERRALDGTLIAYECQCRG